MTDSTKERLAATLKCRLASSATGFGAVIDGVLNIRTVSDTQNAAALNALYILGFRIISNCEDTDCDCKVKLLSRLSPSTEIRRVTVEAPHA